MFSNMNEIIIPENKFNLTLSLKSSYKENKSIETRIIEKKDCLYKTQKAKLEFQEIIR